MTVREVRWMLDQLNLQLGPAPPPLDQPTSPDAVELTAEERRKSHPMESYAFPLETGMRQYYAKGGRGENDTVPPAVQGCFEACDRHRGRQVSRSTRSRTAYGLIRHHFKSLSSLIFVREVR